MEIVENDKDTGAPVRLNGNYSRDEAGQATYVREVLEIFDVEGVDSAFVFLFALETHPHRPDGGTRTDQRLVPAVASSSVIRAAGTGQPR
jgi:hypothetical protein